MQQAVVAVAGTGQAFDVPAGAPLCWSSRGSGIDYLGALRLDGNASIPTTSSTPGSSTNAELNPSSRNIGSTLSCTGLSVVSASTGYLTMAWYGN
jgi:hypothetical protein